MQDIWEATPSGSQLVENHYYSKQRWLSSELYVPGFPQANLREFGCIWHLQHHSPLQSSTSLIKYIFDAAYLSSWYIQNKFRSHKYYCCFRRS